METIRDRAENFACVYSQPDTHFAVKCYSMGAQEQLAIDIDKALSFWHKILDKQGINQVVFADFVKTMHT